MSEEPPRGAFRVRPRRITQVIMRYSTPVPRSRRRLAGVLAASALVASLLPGTARAATEPPLKAADDGARITAQTWLDSRMFDATVESPALGQTVQVRVIVPQGWSRTAKRTWPTLYAYHGGRDTYVSWTRSTDIEATSANWDALIVTPEGGEHGSYTNYWNGGKGGIPKWETFHTVELLQLIQRNYRASTVRAAMGISSGAEGAVYYAAHHPGMFKFVASYSGLLHITQAGIPAIMMSESILLNEGFDPFIVFGVPGLPKDDANWRAHDPYVIAAGLRGTGIFVSAGTTGNPGPLDPPNLPWDQYIEARVVAGGSEQMVGSTNKSFVARLKALKIPFTADLYGDGWHQWLYWQREMHKAWPKIMAAIGAKQV